MLTRESYSLNKPSTKMSAKKAHPTREIHHQTIGALGFCCFFSVVCVPLLCLVGVSSSTFSTINIIPRVSCYFIFFVVPLAIVTWHFVSLDVYHLIDIQIENVWMPPFFGPSFFFCSRSLSLHIRAISMRRHIGSFGSLSLTLFSHIWFVCYFFYDWHIRVCMCLCLMVANASSRSRPHSRCILYALQHDDHISGLGWLDIDSIDTVAGALV